VNVSLKIAEAANNLDCGRACDDGRRSIVHADEKLTAFAELI